MNMNDDRTSSHAKGVRPAGQLGGLLAKGGKLVQEDDEGAVEYKWRLTSIAPSRFEHLVTQMKFRVAEGRGQCVYELGVDDDGHPRGLTDPDFAESLDTLRRMADKLGYYLTVIHERKVQSTEPGAKEGEMLTCAELHVSRSKTNETQDLRIAMCGAVDAGKSTLVSVLANGTLDDGNGSVRQLVFNHKHELNTGRTSSVSEKVVGFDSDGKVTNYDADDSAKNFLDDGVDGGLVAGGGSGGNDTMFASAANFYGTSTAHCMTETIAERSVKLVTLMDLAGSEKYSKTTLSGITTKTPSYACVVASVTQSKDSVVKQVEMCTSLRTRFFIVVNKIDRVSADQRMTFLDNLAGPLDHLGFQTKVVSSEQEATKCAVGLKANLIQHPAARPGNSPPPASLEGSNSNPNSGPSSPERPDNEPQIVPVFFVSCVRGDGCENLKRFLHNLPPAVDDPQSVRDLPPEILVDQCFNVERVGHVFAGFVKQGVVEVGSKLSIGPDRRGNFVPVTVASIHVGGTTVRKVTPGLEATFSFFEPLPRALDVNRKGINIIDRNHSSVTVCMEFDAEVTVQNLVGVGASTKVQPGQEPVCYCRNIRQAVKIVSIDRGSLAKGQFGLVKCRFLYHPEVLDVDGVVVLGTANARMIGTTTSCSPISPATANCPSPQMFPNQEFELVPPMGEEEGMSQPVTTQEYTGDLEKAAGVDGLVDAPETQAATVSAEGSGNNSGSNNDGHDGTGEEQPSSSLYGREKKHKKYKDSKKKGGPKGNPALKGTKKKDPEDEFSLFAD